MSTGTFSPKSVGLASVCPGDNDKVGILARLNSASDPLKKDLGVYDVFTFQLAASFRENLRG